MKKIITLLLALAAIFCLGGCAEEANPTEPSEAKETEHIHKYTSQIITPTCTEEGRTVYTCNCGDTYDDGVTAPLGHSWSEWAVAEKGDCTKGEISTRVCNACAEAEEKEETEKYHNYGENGICPGCGHKTSVGLEYTLSKDKTCYYVSGIGTCEDTTVIIPSVYNKLPVTG